MMSLYLHKKKMTTNIKYEKNKTKWLAMAPALRIYVQVSRHLSVFLKCSRLGFVTVAV